MTFGVSIFLGALGAILRYAVADSVDGVDLATIGLILMIAGGIGLVVAFVQVAMRRRHYVVDQRPVVQQPPVMQRRS
ncbi:MAG: hypothetical protein JNK12_17335 [Acidimicrobiales bacterium]|nr:hypothetical protein [Acidimicrobiales bacterium]